MNTKSINNIYTQYEVTTNWFLFALADISDKDGSKTISDHSNSLEWLSGHLITGRYRNILRLGVKIEPYKYLDKFINQTLPPPNAIAFTKNIQYPNLTECREQWTEYSTILLQAIKNVEENILNAELPFPIPTGGKTIEDALVFMAMHETYHIGQMSMIRKALGYKSMQLSIKK